MAASGPTGDVITQAMMRDIYRVEARLEACSQGKPLVIVDSSIV
jgi:iron complex transport system ATP-binding protein